MIITTTDSIEGKQVKEVFGIVQGNTVRSRWFGRDIAAGLKQLVGGEIKSYTEMVSKSREEAVSRMVSEAEKKGANAIVCVRFTMGEIMPGSIEIFTFGTAVKLK